MRRLWMLMAGAVLAVFGIASTASALTSAPVNRPGPKLQVAPAELAASLQCVTGLRAAHRQAVLLVPPTIFDPDDAYNWNYAPALAAQGIPTCEVTVPNHTDGDIQVAAEYVVHAIRYMHRVTGRKVMLFGWSQGASTLPRWALRWWPGARRQVSSLVGIAPLNNTGSVVANGPCVPGSCVPAAWQQAVGSNFMAALNSRRQVFDHIAYTAIYSRTDDVVTPDVDGSLSHLPEGANVLNVALQDVCPDLSEHLLIPASNTGWSIALDAFRHPGHPAQLKRIDPSTVCAQPLMPAVTPVDLATEEAHLVSLVGPHLLEGQTPAEPPLAPYVTAR